MSEFPKWVDLPTLAELIDMTEDEVLDLVASGSLPRPERKERWRWESIVEAIDKGDKRDRVYFVESGDFIKIGFSRNLPRRLADLQDASPYPVRLLHDFWGNFNYEADLHRRFKHINHRNEWFHKTEELLSFIQDLKNET